MVLADPPDIAWTLTGLIPLWKIKLKPKPVLDLMRINMKKIIYIYILY